MNSSTRTETQTYCDNKNCISIWPNWLGHKNFDAIRSLIKNKLAEGIEINNCKHKTICTKSIEGKLAIKPYPKAATNRSKDMLTLIHSVLCGPMTTQTHSGKRYFITFTDDYSRCTTIYLISHK